MNQDHGRNDRDNSLTVNQNPSNQPTGRIQSFTTVRSEMTPFIGRKTELKQLETLLMDERVRLVTIVGAGGMGKSCIASKAAKHVSSIFENQVCYVPLVSVATCDQLMAELQESLAMQFPSLVSSQEFHLNHMSDKSFLLILDNFEHLLAAALSSVLNSR